MSIKLHRTAVNLGLLLALVAGFTLILQTNNQPKAYAAFNNAQLISNSVFLNARSMSASQIQSFLNDKGSGLATLKFKFNCYGQASQERQWYTAAGAPCDKKVPASTIIYYVAQSYGVNPQVILATMQKEQSLTTAPNPTSWQLNQAMGYACPDSGNCLTSSSFFYQVDNGTWALRYHYERANGNNNWWWTSSSWVCGTAKRFYKPNLYPGQSVKFYDGNNKHYGTYHLANAATSAFYCYTPHAYNNPHGLYGLPKVGTSGQYYSGSYNFVRFFEIWFGSTHYVIKGSIANYYNANSGDSVLGEPVHKEVKDKSGFYWQKFERGYVAGQSSTGYYAVKGSIGKQYNIDNGPSTLGKPLGAENKDSNGVWSQKFSKGYIAGQSNTGYYAIKGSIGKYYNKNKGTLLLGKPLGVENKGAVGMYWQKFDKGYIVGTRDTGYWVSSGAIRDYWSSNDYQAGPLGIPTGSIKNVGDGTYQNYQNGTVIGSDGTGYYTVQGSIGATYKSNLSNNYSQLGFPLSNEEKHEDGVYSQKYENGYIVGKSGKYYMSKGSIRDYWVSLDKWSGKMGIVTGPITTGSRNMLYQHYVKGVIVVNPNNGEAWESKGSIRKAWADLGYQVGKMGYPTGPEKYSASNNVWSQTYEHGTIYTKSGQLYKVSYDS